MNRDIQSPPLYNSFGGTFLYGHKAGGMAFKQTGFYQGRHTRIPYDEINFAHVLFKKGVLMHHRTTSSAEWT